MPFIVTQTVFEITTWTLCGLSTVFLASRFVVRLRKEGQLRKSDYVLMLALPSLLGGVGLLQSSLDIFYDGWPTGGAGSMQPQERHTSAAPRLTAAIELLWLTIYCVKASFFAQFKFNKPLLAHVSPRLTRYYWTAVVICGAAYILTLVIPVLLCPRFDRCRYLLMENTLAWETALIVLDIATDILVISVPLSLIWMANFALKTAFINTYFKSLSIFIIAIATYRLAAMYNTLDGQVKYLILTFWLAVEAAVAVIMASISTYRIVLVDYLATRNTRDGGRPSINGDEQALRPWASAGQTEGPKISDPHLGTPLSDMSIQFHPRFVGEVL